MENNSNGQTNQADSQIEKSSKGSAKSKWNDIPQQSRVTQFLKDWSAGRSDRFEEMIEVAIKELQKIARQKFLKFNRAGADRPTELVSYIYERLKRQNPEKFNDSKAFYSYCAQMITNLLRDGYRARRREKDTFSFDQFVDFSFLAHAGEVTIDDRIYALELLEMLRKEKPVHAKALYAKEIIGLSDKEILTDKSLNLKDEKAVQNTVSYAKTWIILRLKDKKKKNN